MKSIFLSCLLVLVSCSSIGDLKSKENSNDLNAIRQINFSFYNEKSLTDLFGNPIDVNKTEKLNNLKYKVNGSEVDFRLKNDRLVGLEYEYKMKKFPKNSKELGENQYINKFALSSNIEYDENDKTVGIENPFETKDCDEFFDKVNLKYTFNKENSKKNKSCISNKFFGFEMINYNIRENLEKDSIKKINLSIIKYNNRIFSASTFIDKRKKEFKIENGKANETSTRFNSFNCDILEKSSKTDETAFGICYNENIVVTIQNSINFIDKNKNTLKEEIMEIVSSLRFGR